MYLSQGGFTGKMIRTRKISLAVEEIVLESPLRYYLLYCFYCGREWISDAMHPHEVYTPPKTCNFVGCRSKNWQDPVKAERVRRLRAKRQERAQGMSSSLAHTTPEKA